MQQRAMIAMALASEPRIIVADEPTTALDATIQAQILELLREVKQRLGTAILLITHNLGIVAEMADRVAVLYAGQIVELAPAAGLLQNPLHPYTRALIQSIPRMNDESKRLTSIPGSVPRLGDYPTGCRFFPRCPVARTDCAGKPVGLAELAPGRYVRCAYARADGSHLNP
jgi:oligopeptide/dipeptide ABC transporter ATP-binding protein